MTRRSTERGELRDAVEAFAEAIVAKLRDQILADMGSLLGAGAVPTAKRPGSTTKARAEAERRAKARPRPAPRASVEEPVKVATRSKAAARGKSSAPQPETRPAVARRPKAAARPEAAIAPGRAGEAVAQPSQEPDVVTPAPTVAEAVVHGAAGLGELDVLVGVPRRIVPPRATAAVKRVEKPVVVAPEPFRPVPPIKRVRAPMVMLTADDFMSLPRDEEKVEPEGAEPAVATGT